MEDYDRVRRMRFVEELSLREISRQTGLHRSTVKKMIELSAPPGYRRGQESERPVLGRYVPVIDAILKSDASTAPKKQRHTAKRIFDRLREGAHRLAPRDLARDDEAARGVRAELIDAARTTRKYGLGWLFISQTLSSLDTEILQQLRIFFFGFGLALGQVFQWLRQLVGSSGTALDLHQLFRDPHSAFDTKSRQYSFMTIGPVSPLSFSGSPLFLNVFNQVDSFLQANNLYVEPPT